MTQSIECTRRTKRSHEMVLKCPRKLEMSIVPVKKKDVQLPIVVIKDVLLSSGVLDSFIGPRQ